MEIRPDVDKLKLGGVANITDDQQERLCEICEDCIFGHSVNTNQYNMCEGSHCDDAFEYYIDELEDERDENVKFLEKIFNDIM